MTETNLIRTADRNVYDTLVERFPRDGRRLFAEGSDGRRVLYEDIGPLTARMASVLARAGVGKGDRVAGVLEKSPEGILLYLAASRLGAIYLPVHSGLTASEIGYIIADAQPRAIVCDPAWRERIEVEAARHGVARIFTLDTACGGSLMAEATSPNGYVAACSGNDANAIVYTSGTTGKPKGAIITHGLVGWNALALARSWRIGPDDVLLHANPMAFGLFGTSIPMLAAGAAMLLLPKFDADDVIAALPRATMFAGVPTYYARLLARPDFDAALCRGMRLFITGSAPMRADMFAAFQQRTGHVLLDRYGLTEALLVTSNDAGEKRLPDNSGRPLAGSRLRLVDDRGAPVVAGETGRIEVWQPYMFHGYWNAPEKTKEAFTSDGWFKTGDFGRLDEQGHISVLGRGADLIISGGFNVYPKEVETHLNQADNIAESAVIGVPHPDFGEAVVAVVQLTDRSAGLAVAPLLKAMRQDLAGYKVPKHVEIVDEMPRNTLGKIQKNLLKSRLAALFERKVENA